jgi:predicted ferric reductase
MSTWEAITWDVARAGGMTAYLLVTLSVVAGLAMTLQFQSMRWPRIINNELHNFLALLAAIFVGVHILAVALDPFTKFGLGDLLLPFVSAYRPIWMAMGIVALYLGLAVGLSTLLRPKLGYALWRRLHILTFATYLLVTLHGFFTGSDATSWWALSVYLASIGVVGSLIALRLSKRSHPGARKHGAGAHVAQTLPSSYTR